MSDPDINAELRAAARQGNDAEIIALLVRGADPNRASGNGWTALIEAARKGHASTVRLLLQNGADVLGRNDKNKSALVYAVENGHEEIARLLIASGAPVDDRNHRGDSLLYLAAGQKSGAILYLLMENGASLENSGALQAAALRGDVSRLRFLADHGAEVNGFHGNDTALMLAASYGRRDAVASCWTAARMSARSLTTAGPPLARPKTGKSRECSANPALAMSTASTSGACFTSSRCSTLFLV